MIIISLCLSFGLIIIYYSLLKEAKELNWFKGNKKIFNLISLPIGIIFVAFILTSTFTSLASNYDEEKEIVITNIYENSGYWGFKSLSSYTIEGKTENDEEIVLHISILMPLSFKKKIDELSIGNIMKVKYTNGLNYLYYYEICN